MPIPAETNRQFKNQRTGEEFSLPIGKVFGISHYDDEGNRHNSRWQIEGIRHAPYPPREITKPADTEEVKVICRPIEEGTYVDVITMEAHVVTPEDVVLWFPESVSSLLKQEEKRSD
jgi:hypothetical protein